MECSEYSLNCCWSCPDCGSPNWLTEKQIEQMNNIICPCGHKFAITKPVISFNKIAKVLESRVPKSKLTPDLNTVKTMLQVQGFDTLEISKVLKFAKDKKLTDVQQILTQGIAAL